MIIIIDIIMSWRSDTKGDKVSVFELNTSN